MIKLLFCPEYRFVNNLIYFHYLLNIANANI
uniref:Uncharacterized protein n=1 Tax=Arundo donax TaxID=35708 RepID=A0A0A9B3W9_ARUDO